LIEGYRLLDRELEILRETEREERRGDTSSSQAVVEEEAKKSEKKDEITKSFSFEVRAQLNYKLTT
jgi:hypothetical protein